MSLRKSPSTRKVLQKSPTSKQRMANKSKYVSHVQLGAKGKEARTFLVTDKFGCEYAMKTFRKNKSSSKILEEVTLQRRCSDMKISPKIIDFSTDGKYIVMEKGPQNI